MPAVGSGDTRQAALLSLLAVGLLAAGPTAGRLLLRGRAAGPVASGLLLGAAGAVLGLLVVFGAR